MQQKTLMRVIRRQRELSIHEVAKATGIDASTISRAERGLITLTEENQRKVAAFFGRPASELLAEAPPQVA